MRNLPCGRLSISYGRQTVKPFPAKSHARVNLGRIPKIFFPLLGFLPRVSLNFLETRFLPSDFNQLPDASTLRRIWSGHSTAFVRQTVYPDLYCCPSRTPSPEAVKSTLRRTGPMGFLLDCDADFFLVHEDPSPECRNWEESAGSNPATREQDLARFRRLTGEIPLAGAHGHSQSPQALGMAVQEVDWGKFAVVVSLDIAVPLELRRRYPQVMWVYFPADPGTPTAKRARRTPPEGFSVSLTHTHRRFPVRPGLSSLAIECPYSFQSSWSWDQVWPDHKERRGIMVEHQTFDLLKDEQRRQLEDIGPVRKPQGSVSKVAALLRASKYYLRLQGGPLSGNGQVEAIMAGCLALGNPATYVQRSLFIPATVAPDFEQALSRIRFFESHPEEFEATRFTQQTVAEFVCFRRPAHQLLQHLKKWQRKK